MLGAIMHCVIDPSTISTASTSSAHNTFCNFLMASSGQVDMRLVVATPETHRTSGKISNTLANLRFNVSPHHLGRFGPRGACTSRSSGREVAAARPLNRVVKGLPILEKVSRSECHCCNQHLRFTFLIN